MKISELIAQELSLGLRQVENALALFSEGGTVPFIAQRKNRGDERNSTPCSA